MSASPAILEVFGLSAGYGNRRVVQDLELAVRAGEIFLLLGHNGAGKTTVLNTIFGLLEPSAGKVMYKRRDITGRSPRENVKDGIALVPQGHAVFKRLTVHENLVLGGFTVGDQDEIAGRIDAVEALFPILKERRTQLAGTMSGGQQQMLAIGIAMMLSPKLLILDEPSIGLAPNLVTAVMQSVTQIRDKLGTTILIVEQNIEKSLPIADRVMIMRTGREVYCGSPDGLRDHSVLVQYL
jgi:branched-chain amino acid transport system ATP-binding protein